MQWREAFKDFSHFTITRFDFKSGKAIVSGNVTKPGQLSLNHYSALACDLHEGIYGNLIELNPDVGNATIDSIYEKFPPATVVGAEFPIFDGYQIEQVRFALDPALIWERKLFVTLDAFVQPAEAPGWRKSTIATAEDRQRTDGVITPAAWNHEHCRICDQRIGSEGEPEGYVTGKNIWVCIRCHDRYVSRRNVRFVLHFPSPDELKDDGSDSAAAKFNRLIDDYDLRGIEALLDSGADVEQRIEGWTPLMFALARGHLSLVQLLMRRGANVNAATPERGDTPLRLAKLAEQNHVVELLTSGGATG